MSTTPPGNQDTVALAAMRVALARPKSLSLEEEQAFLRFRAKAWVRRIETLSLVRRGRRVFRRVGRGGADLPCHPIEWDIHQALLKFQQLLGRVFRRPPVSALGVQSRQTKAAARAQRVLDVYPQYQHRGRHAAALIAKTLDEHVFYVRRVLRETLTTVEIDSKV